VQPRITGPAEGRIVVDHRQVGVASDDELAVADPGGTTIAAVAARWGFLHAGRFSSVYRRKFGVLPSETLHGRHPMKGKDSRQQGQAGPAARRT
jgi:AraC-like DNA-binding protein